MLVDGQVVYLNMPWQCSLQLDELMQLIYDLHMQYYLWRSQHASDMQA